MSDNNRHPSAAWASDRPTHARLCVGGAIADVWQAIPDDDTAWIWAVKDGDCYVQLHESMASAHLAAEDSLVSDGVGRLVRDDAACGWRFEPAVRDE